MQRMESSLPEEEEEEEKEAVNGSGGIGWLTRGEIPCSIVWMDKDCTNNIHASLVLVKCEGRFYTGWCFYLISRWPFEKNQLFSQPDVQLHHKMHCLVKNMWCWIWASYMSGKEKIVHSSNNRILHRVEFIPCKCCCWILRQLLNFYIGDFKELIGLRGNVGSCCKILRWFHIGELSHNLKPPEGEFVERNRAKCVEAEVVSSRTFLGLAGCLFPFAVMVTHLEGGKMMVERNCHIAFAADPVCDCLGQSYTDQTWPNLVIFRAGDTTEGPMVRLVVGWRSRTSSCHRWYQV